MLKRIAKGCLAASRQRQPFLRYLSSHPDALEMQTQNEEASQEQSMPDVMTESLKQVDYFRVAEMFNVQDLFEAKVHLGHREGTLNDFMKPYIFGSRLGHLVLDLDQTIGDLQHALNITAHIAFRGGIILFVCRSNQHQLLVEKTAVDCGEYSHTRFWQSGLFTNATSSYGQLVRLPDLVILLNTQNDILAQHEVVNDAAKMLIPTIGIVDTNCDPRLITYPVAGNDESHQSILLYCQLFKEAILRGKRKNMELEAKEEVVNKL